MSQPSVAKAFNQKVLPQLSGIGMRSLGGKRYGRANSDVVQFLFLHVENRIKRSFMIEFCTILLVEPHKNESLAHGGRFPIDKLRQGTWYRADTEENLEKSFDSVLNNLPALIDWYEASFTIKDFLKSYAVRVDKEFDAIRTNGHTSFTFACGHAALENHSDAAKYAERAVGEFQRIDQEFVEKFGKSIGWAKERMERVEELKTAMAIGTTASLLEKWRSDTRAALKLDR